MLSCFSNLLLLYLVQILSAAFYFSELVMALQAAWLGSEDAGGVCTRSSLADLPPDLLMQLAVVLLCSENPL